MKLEEALENATLPNMLHVDSIRKLIGCMRVSSCHRKKENTTSSASFCCLLIQFVGQNEKGQQKGFGDMVSKPNYFILLFGSVIIQTAQFNYLAS